MKIPEVPIAELKKQVAQMESKVNDLIQELRMKREMVLQLNVKLLTSDLVLCDQEKVTGGCDNQEKQPAEEGENNVEKQGTSVEETMSSDVEIN